jgi:hypothetical protein
MNSDSTASDPPPAAPASEETPPALSVSSTGSPPTAESPFAEWPYRDVDPRTGRLRPISAEEWRSRMEELTRLLAEIDAADDTPDEVYDDVLRGIDEERRRQGRPPAFEGCY